MSGTLSVEERVIEKVRAVLAADDTIVNYTKSRIFASHPATIEAPKFPCVSLHLLDSLTVYEGTGYVQMTLQIDSWLPASQFDMADALTLHRKIRENLHRQNLSDSTIGVKVASASERLAGPLLYEEDTDLLHYPVQYTIVAY